MPTDPLALRSQAPLLDAWLRFHEQRPTPFTIPGHKQRHDLVGDVVAGDVPLYAGLDTMKLIADSMYDEYKDPNYAPPPLLLRMVEAGQLGKKSGKGFYSY